jgi:D-tagatose-1,6-bisphosphate aldolase subunit GatZ/KbaZ
MLKRNSTILKKTNLPITEYILRRIAEMELKGQQPTTLLAACPNSVSVIRAALRAAKRNNGPIKFAATLNQVDGDKGYTGFTQADFVRYIEIECEKINFEGPVIIAIDHGGPWLKDKQTIEKWSLQDAMDGVKKSFEEALIAGYDLIHVDPTVDIYLNENQNISIEVVVSRTIELIKHIEEFREKNNIAPISYEVGTEEVHGGLADENTFDAFLHLLKDGLKAVNLPGIWPCFIVGKVGTDLHTATFDPGVASILTQKVKPYGSLIKGHYTDSVSNPEEYPLSGMGAANVGPEFTISEYEALIELEKIECELYVNKRIAIKSNIQELLWASVIESDRWRKWLSKNEKGLAFDQLEPERQEWLISTGCRYIWQKPEVVVARYLLYDNLNSNGFKAEEIVLSRIERDIDRYYQNFNLINLNKYL